MKIFVTNGLQIDWPLFFRIINFLRYTQRLLPSSCSKERRNLNHRWSVKETQVRWWEDYWQGGVHKHLGYTTGTFEGVEWTKLISGREQVKKYMIILKNKTSPFLFMLHPALTKVLKSFECIKQPLNSQIYIGLFFHLNTTQLSLKVT